VLSHLICVEIEQASLNIAPAPVRIVAGYHKALGSHPFFVHVQNDQFRKFITLVKRHISHRVQRAGDRETLQPPASGESMLSERPELFSGSHLRKFSAVPKSGTLDILNGVGNAHAVKPLVSLESGKPDAPYRHSVYVRRNHDVRRVIVKKSGQCHTAAVTG